MSDHLGPGRVTRCGTCLASFPAKTPQESADLARAHVEGGCEKDPAVAQARAQAPAPCSEPQSDVDALPGSRISSEADALWT